MGVGVWYFSNASDPYGAQSQEAPEGRRSIVPVRRRAPEFSEPELPLPENGALTRYHSSEAVAPFGVRTRGAADGHYFIKLVESDSDESVLTVFVRGGQGVEVAVPLGSMEMRYAVGSSWYGEQFLFGPDTTYHTADKVFAFTESGNTLSGFTVELTLRRGGNLPTSKIPPGQW